MTEQMLSNAEVNERLALLDGIERYIDDLWRIPDGTGGMVYKKHPPDYCGDWKYAGPLLEKLCEADMLENGPPGHLSDGRVSFSGWYIPWYCNETNQNYESTGDTLTEAISRAALAWKEDDDLPKM